MNRDEVIDAITRERQRLVHLAADLAGDAERRTVTEEGWTAHDVLAHCVHRAGELARALGAPLHEPSWVGAAGGRDLTRDEWNARVIEHYRAVPRDIVIADLGAVSNAVIAQLRKRSDADLAAVARETYEHWTEHAADLERTLVWTT